MSEPCLALRRPALVLATIRASSVTETTVTPALRRMMAPARSLPPLMKFRHRMLVDVAATNKRLRSETVSLRALFSFHPRYVLRRR